MKKKTHKKAHARKVTIVKRGWHVEHYDERKVYGSCVFACRMAHLSQKEAERIAEHITPIITHHVRKKKLISSDDIYRMLGIPISVARIKCAMLSLKTLHGAIKTYEARN